MSHRRCVVALVGWVGLSAAAGWVSVAATSSLSLPHGASGRELARWYQEVGPEMAVIVFLWVVTLGLVAWVGLAAALLLLASWHPAQGLEALAHGVCPPLLRGFAGGVASLSLGLVIGPDVDRDRDPGTAVLRPLDDDPAEQDPSTVDASDPPSVSPPSPSTTMADPAVRTELPQAPPAVAVEVPPRPPAAPAEVPLTVAPVAPAAPGDGERYLVRPGDHFWGIAEELVADDLGRVPYDREVARYWRTLVDANRARLVDPENSDLLYPDQELILPPR